MPTRTERLGELVLHIRGNAESLFYLLSRIDEDDDGCCAARCAKMLDELDCLVDEATSLLRSVIEFPRTTVLLSAVGSELNRLRGLSAVTSNGDLAAYFRERFPPSDAVEMLNALDRFAMNIALEELRDARDGAEREDSMDDKQRRERDQQICEAVRADGKTMTEAAKMFGVNKSTVSRVIKKRVARNATRATRNSLN